MVVYNKWEKVLNIMYSNFHMMTNIEDLYLKISFLDVLNVLNICFVVVVLIINYL
jgi:hypothetical protein